MITFFKTVLQKIQKIEFGGKEQQAFLEDLSAMLGDGVPINRAVETLQIISKGASKKVAASLADGIARGQALAEGMQKWFTQSTIEIIRAGEKSGTLTATLKSASDALARQSGSLGELLAALTYPIIVLCGAFAVIVFIKHSVFESFIAIKPLAQWPSVGQNFYNLATFIQNWWWFLILTLVVLFVGIDVMLRFLIGEVRRGIDHLPLLSLYRQNTAARLMETLGLLLQNGVAFNRCLGILQTNADPYLAWHLLNMEARLSAGQENIADVLDTHLLDTEDLVRLKVVAKGKGFDQALLSLGGRASIRVNKKIAKAAKITGGVILGMGAGLAGMMVLAIYTVGSGMAGGA